MRGRKPPRSLEEFASAVDQQIAEARDAGAFDDLPGQGRPLPDRDTSDPAWWAKQKLQAEGLRPALPPALELRRDVELALERLPKIPSERILREIFEGLNARIRRLNATQMSGPSTGLIAHDLDKMVARWKAAREG
jgi:hypothetical protein